MKMRKWQHSKKYKKKHKNLQRKPKATCIKHIQLDVSCWKERLPKLLNQYLRIKVATERTTDKWYIDALCQEIDLFFKVLSVLWI